MSLSASEKPLRVGVEREGTGAVVSLSGPLTMGTSGQLYEQLMGLVRESPSEVALDLSEVETLDSSGIAVISLAVDALTEAGGKVRARGVSKAQREALGMMPARDRLGGLGAEPEGVVERVGGWGVGVWGQWSAFFGMIYKIGRAFVRMFTHGELPPKGSVIRQSVIIGIDALPIVGLLGALIGTIMAFQAAPQLESMGAPVYVASLVGLSMAREFGPIMTAILLAGRSGSAMAAELGTMTVQEELDALRTMGIEPERYLILPKILALTWVQPALSLMSTFLGIAGGAVIGTMYMGLSLEAYVQRTLYAIEVIDLASGVAKSVMFSFVIGFIGSYCGVTITGGASGVGRATTRAVVLSILTIVISDAIFTALFTIFG